MAIFLCSSGDEERAKASRSPSILSSFDQPNHPPFSPLPPIDILTTGLITSAATQAAKYMLQPPSFVDFLLVRRLIKVAQSIACTSTLKPASRNNCPATIGCVLKDRTSVGARIT